MLALLKVNSLIMRFHFCWLLAVELTMTNTDTVTVLTQLTMQVVQSKSALKDTVQKNNAAVLTHKGFHLKL